MNIYRAVCRIIAGPERTFRVQHVDIGPVKTEAYTAMTPAWGGGSGGFYTVDRTFRPVTARIEADGEVHTAYAMQLTDGDTLGSDLQQLIGARIAMRARKPYGEGTLRKLVQVGACI